MAGSVYIASEGEAITVVLSQGGVVQSVYYDPTLKTLVPTPIIIHADTIFYAPDGTYTVSCKNSAGVELQGGTITLSEASPVVLNRPVIAVSSVGLLGSGGEVAVGSHPLTLVSATSAVTAALWQMISCNTTGGTFAVTLPLASAGKGRISIKWTAGSTAPTFALSGSDHINTSSGPTTGALTLLNQGVVFESDGSGIWEVTTDDLPLSQLDARYALLSGATMTGNLSVPTLTVPSGGTGITQQNRLVGGTASGAPTSGTWQVGDVSVDALGVVWCCITAGTPGTWVIGGAGVEIAYAELNTDQSPGTITTTLADMTGMAVTFTAPARSFKIDLTVPVFIVTGTDYVTVEITDSSNVVVAEGYSISAVSAIATLPLLRAHLPRTGASGAYAITPGNSYTFKMRAATSAATAYMYTYTGTSRPQLSVVTV